MIGRGRRGASAVEFALTLPLLIGLISAILDYGWYLTQAANVTSAVREGTRYAATVNQDDGVTATAIDTTEQALTALGVPCQGGSGCSVDANLGEVSGIESLTVRAQVSFQPLVGIVPTPAHLTAALTMALQDQRGE